MHSLQSRSQQIFNPLAQLGLSKYTFGLKKARYGNKVFPSAKEALFDLKSGNSLFFGGFGLCGCQENLIDAINEIGATNLTCVANNPGTTDWGVGKLIRNNQVKRMVCTYIGGNKTFGQRYQKGLIEAYILPQGTLGERIKAGSFGYPAFYTRTGVGTMVQTGGWIIKYKEGTTEPEILSEPKQSKFFEGREYLREEAMTADYAILTAKKADTLGNLFYHGTARNLNQDMAPAGRITIAEVEEIVEPGQIKPDDIHTPGIFVDRIVKAKNLEKRIEILSLKESKSKKEVQGSSQLSKEQSKKALAARARDRIAKRAAKELKSGMYVNLGIGIPTLVPKFLPADVQIMLHSENGLLGIGDFPRPGEEDADIVNAGKATVTTIPGSSLFPTTVSFGIIRGRHLDMTAMGSMEVSSNGDLANWVIPGKRLNGMGGGMDLVSSGSEVMICMQHMSGGQSKVLKKCTLPLTGSKCVTKLATDLAFFTIKNEKMKLVDLASNMTLEELRTKTEADFEVGENIGTFD